MKELILHMYRTLLSKKFKGEAQARMEIKRRIRGGQTKDEAIVSIYVNYVDVVLGMSAPHPDDAEDLAQLENRH